MSLLVTAAIGWFWLGYVDAQTEDVQELAVKARVNHEADARMQAFLRVNPTPSHGELIEMRLSIDELLNPSVPYARDTSTFMSRAEHWLHAYGPLLGVFLLTATCLALCLSSLRRARSPTSSN
jgi:hypothetical protein